MMHKSEKRKNKISSGMLTRIYSPRLQWQTLCKNVLLWDHF